MRAALAECRWRLGWLLSNTGRYDEALSLYRLARADQEALAAAPGATTESRRDLAATISLIGVLLDGHGQAVGGGGRVPQGAGAPAEAGRRQPRRHRIPPPPGGQPQQPRPPAAEYGKAIGSGGRVPQGAGDLDQKLADDNPAVTEFRSDLAMSPQQPRRPAVADGQAVGGGGRAPQGAGALAEAGRRQPRRHFEIRRLQSVAAWLHGNLG